MSLGWGLSPTAPRGGVGLLGWCHLEQLTERKGSCVYFFFQNDSLTASHWRMEKPRTAQMISASPQYFHHPPMPASIPNWPCLCPLNQRREGSSVLRHLWEKRFPS